MTKVSPSLRLRVVVGPGVMLGPGKAELLEMIHETGSIAAAGRRMNMSYKRAWMLVETMNATFRAPVVEGSRGGSKGGGAVVTETGIAVLAAYRALERHLVSAGKAEIDQLTALLGDIPDGK